jgi:3-hydroxyacyl-CoA dehydrogenase
MVESNNFRTIGILGCGVIGASWATYYLAKGFDVVAVDPGPNAEKQLRANVEEFWPAMERMGLAGGASPERLTFNTKVAAFEDVDFLQENGPERVDVKRSMLKATTDIVRSDVLIATSSSGILISSIQDAAAHPERILLGHPFNPPHLIPLVEVVGGRLTSKESVDRAIAFYTSIGKKPIRLNREILGHIANRLQAALWQEAFYLVDQGVASVTDIDVAIAHGPGLRWALLGPFMNLHLSGGPGGIGHVIDHLGPPIESWWRDLGDLGFTPEVKKKAMTGIDQELAGEKIEHVEEERDDVLLSLLALKAKYKTLK